MEFVMPNNSCHYYRGANFEQAPKKIAFVFSCPGQREEMDGIPASPNGQTGKNLDKLLDLLKIGRECVIITNAWSYVEYKNKTGRSEALCSEIKQKFNLKRLMNELYPHELNLVVLSGSKAQYAYSKAGLGNHFKARNVPHLGSRGLQSIREEELVGVDDVGFTEKRLLYLCDLIRCDISGD